MEMGIGRLGSPRTIIKRKFRWTLEIETPLGLIPRYYVKTAARPQLDIDETEINFLNATTWVPGKGKWQTMTVKYIDVSNDDQMILYDWIATVYDFTDPVFLKQSEKSGYSGTALLTLYDGCGKALELWALKSCWPKSINFGDLDYANSEMAEIDLTLRFSEVTYQNICGRNPRPICSGCEPQRQVLNSPQQPTQQFSQQFSQEQFFQQQ